MFVYLKMNFSLIDKTYIKCRIAKFIRIPVVCRKNIYGSISLNIHIDEITNIYDMSKNEHKTLFHILNDSIRFITQSSQDYDKLKILPIFDYENGRHIFLGINRKKYNLVDSDTKPRSFVRTPSGDLYCLVDYQSPSSKDSEYRILSINNLTKGKVAFKVVSGYHTNLRKRANHISLYIDYTEPIANSYVVVVSVGNKDASSKEIANNIYVHLIDLVYSSVEKIEYNLEDYVMRELQKAKEYILRYLYQNDIRMVNLLMNKDIFKKPKIQYVDKYEDKKGGVMKGEIKKYDDKTLAHSRYSLEFQIELEVGVPPGNIKMEIKCTFLLLCYYENNEVNINLVSGEGGYIKRQYEKDIIYHIPSNITLLHKKYKSHVQLDINKSHLYSITTVCNDIVILDNIVYTIYEDRYVPMLYILYNVARHKGFTISSIANYFLAFVNPRYILKNDKTCAYAKIENFPYRSHEVKVVRLNKILESIDKNVECQKNLIVSTISDLVETIRIGDLVNCVKRKTYGKTEAYRNWHYKYYLDEDQCCLYLFTLFYNYANNYKSYVVRFTISRHNIDKYPYSCDIIFKSEEYYLESVQDDLLKASGKIMQEVIFKSNRIVRPKIHFHDFLVHLRNFLLTYKKYEGSFLYDKEVLIRTNDIKTEAEIKDIKYNRQCRFNYFVNIDQETERESPVFKYYDKVIFYKIYPLNEHIRHGHKIYEMDLRKWNNVNFILILSEMELVETIKLKVYK